jgi:Ca-activated chloride channel family protein
MVAPYLLAQVRSNTQIVANVELVQIPVVVFDDKGAVATSLKKNDFRILDDGVEQKILYCERDRVPVSFVILADVSSSMTRKLPFVQEATLSLLDPPDKQGLSVDEFSVLGIETRAKMLLPFTRDEKDMERRLPLLLEPTNGSTALFDGIYFGVTAAEREAANEHRAMIIISDGGDNHSRYNLYETKHMLEEADVPAFAVMAGPSFELPPFLVPQPKKRTPGSKGGVLQFPDLRTTGSRDDYIGPAERRGPRNLKTLTEASGGGVFTAGQLEDLPRIVRTIGQAVRYRYVLTYRPIRDPKTSASTEKAEGDPSKHKIRIELFPKEKFKGFYLPYYKHGYRSFQ